MRVLDTNILSELTRPAPNPVISRRLLSAPRGTYCASELTRFELRYGALLHPHPEQLWARIQALILPVPTWLPVDSAISERAAVIAAQLRRMGRPVGGLADPIIAATALEAGLPLVTRNVRHFESIEDLDLENWFEQT